LKQGFAIDRVRDDEEDGRKKEGKGTGIIWTEKGSGCEANHSILLLLFSLHQSYKSFSPRSSESISFGVKRKEKKGRKPSDLDKK
jgi:hypothetical protein